MVVGIEVIMPPIAPPHCSIQMATTMAMMKPTLPEMAKRAQFIDWIPNTVFLCS